ncbi:uncharacterized protein N7482_010016 [Penicillium canariense]|uniref:GPI inositol-deacylase n=1 Tax=Penicillium canariense TaxID=189055 RepID=A0A9W9HR62_9EURO|nr:uncharacterized protein N7482_010016 [Penicillium canariense]KAJ5153538.1 hypothetical protein N7482_010016 [Penicillium canariense]
MWKHGSDILDPIAGSMASVLGIFICLLMWSFGLIWLAFALATVLYSSPSHFSNEWCGFTFPLRGIRGQHDGAGGGTGPYIFQGLWHVASCTAVGVWRGNLSSAPCLRILALKEELSGVTALIIGRKNNSLPARTPSHNSAFNLLLTTNPVNGMHDPRCPQGSPISPGDRKRLSRSIMAIPTDPHNFRSLATAQVNLTRRNAKPPSDGWSHVVSSSYLVTASETRVLVSPGSKNGNFSFPSISIEYFALLDLPVEHDISTINSGPVSFIFVHGLNPRGRNDHPFETWTHANGKFWPTDFLAEDIPYARVFVYGYNTNITNPQTMSTASIKDHANTLLNLLDLERGPQFHSLPPRIIFIGHSLGGLVIKQALLNAKEDPKYKSIANATFGLVFFGTPHRGAKAVELGKIAARIARFVSKGNASNDLLDCLEHNSLFTRQMTDRFRHQLEDYRVVSFIEGKEVLLGGAGPASISHLVVDEESAVLGLSGLRETQLKLDADHSQMCKVGTRGPMYRLIKGNIKQLVDQALLSEQGFLPQPSPHPIMGRTAPPLPPRMHSNSSTPYPPPGQPPPTTPRVIGALYTALNDDPRSIHAAELKNRGKWDDARIAEYEIFQDHLRSPGPDHVSTLSMGYNLAEIELESSYLQKAGEWCQWVMDNSRRVFGNSHALPLRSESLMAEILYRKGKYHESESICANVLARQQMSVGEDHLDTLDTRRRLGLAYNALNRRESAIMTAEKLTETLNRLVGDNHIRFYWALLDALEFVIYNHGEETAALVRVFEPDVQQAFELLPQVYEDLRVGLGDTHPVTIRALSLHGRGLTRAHQIMEASETLRRALAISEDALGPDHPLTIDIVGSIGVMYTLQGALDFTGTNPPSEAIPWLVRYLNWVERRKGLDNPETQTTLVMLGNLHFAAQEYEPAQKYFERALAASRGPQGTAMQQRVSNQLQLCQANNMFTTRRGMGSGLGGFLSSLQRF